MIKIRSGIGYDIHRLQQGGMLFLGGIKVSDSMSAVAHSDGDVLIHAIIDSLLGAMGEPDIGELFPDSDPKWKGVRSILMLEEVNARLITLRFEIVNIDCIIVTEMPKISPLKDAIRTHLADILKISSGEINIKAKTKEKMDSVGRGEAIECYAVSMIRSLG